MLKQIIKAGAIAGVLDIVAACIQAYLSKNISPDIVLKYIYQLHPHSIYCMGHHYTADYSSL